MKVESASPSGDVRQVFCVLSARSLPYARLALRTLVQHCEEPMVLRLLTDEATDRDQITEAMQAIDVPARHRWSVHAQAEIDDLAADQFAAWPALRQFRFGHPCWRKNTDPLLFSEPGDEMVILDPDLYFPNRFRFEPTPEKGLLLMWQPTHCLLPRETVDAAYNAGVKLAHHTDIGVAHARMNFDLEWLDWFIARLGGESIPRAMHVESVIWAALGMREGGAYLDPAVWHCWTANQWKRVARKLGMSGPKLLRHEDFNAMKCFHGGGPAKWWLNDYLAEVGERPTLDRTAHGPLHPFEELTAETYYRGEHRKDVARRLGYYKLFGGGSA